MMRRTTCVALSRRAAATSAVRRAAVAITPRSTRAAAAVTSCARRSFSSENTGGARDAWHRTAQLAPDDALYGVEEGHDVLLPCSNGVQQMVLNRPKAMHALNLDMVRSLTNAIKGSQHGEDVRALVIRSTGTRAFCAGGDIVALYKAGQEGGDTETFFREEYYLNMLTSMAGKPLVPLMDGATMGGGVGLSQHCHYRIASENSLFAMPETAIGFFPDVGGSHFLPRLDGELGMYLALTGARLKGYDLVHAGLASHYIDSAWMQYLCVRLEDSAGGADFVPSTINMIHNCDPYDDEHHLKPFSLAPYMNSMARCFGQDSVENILAALEEEKEHPEWAAKQIKTMKRMSPTSLKVTFEQMRRGARMNLADCLRMEFRMCQNFMRGKDFFTGVDSMLISKDRNPAWDPATLADVSNDLVQSYFEMPEGVEELVLPIDDMGAEEDRLWHPNFLDEPELHGGQDSYEAYVPQHVRDDLQPKWQNERIAMPDSTYWAV